jgi:nicotinamide-nucleotide amidase
MSNYSQRQIDRAIRVLALARAKDMMITTAESCTGGLIAGCFTEIPGASDVFDRGFVVYSYGAKMDILGVRSETLAETGAVSPETAEEMATGALTAGGAHLAVAVTGIAGPGGATPDKPVGLVYIGIAVKGRETVTYKNNFSGDRTEVRNATLDRAFALIEEALTA